MAPPDHSPSAETSQTPPRERDEKRGLGISRGSFILWRSFLVRLVAAVVPIGLLGPVFFKRATGAMLLAAIPVALLWVTLRAWFPSAHSELQLVVTESPEGGGSDAVIDLSPGARLSLTLRLWWRLIWPLAAGCLVLSVILVTFVKDRLAAQALLVTAIVFGPYVSIALALRKRLKHSWDMRVPLPVPRLRPTGKDPVVFLPGAVRHMRAAKLRLFGGKPPAWASDLYSLLKYVNVLELAPTLVAVAFTPVHFFSILDRSGKPLLKVYKTPMKFLVTGCVGFGSDDRLDNRCSVTPNS